MRGHSWGHWRYSSRPEASASTLEPRVLRTRYTDQGLAFELE